MGNLLKESPEQQENPLATRADFVAYYGYNRLRNHKRRDVFVSAFNNAMLKMDKKIVTKKSYVISTIAVVCTGLIEHIITTQPISTAIITTLGIIGMSIVTSTFFMFDMEHEEYNQDNKYNSIAWNIIFGDKNNKKIPTKEEQKIMKTKKFQKALETYRTNAVKAAVIAKEVVEDEFDQKALGIPTFSQV